jgi:hypothetical protein
VRLAQQHGHGLRLGARLHVSFGDGFDDDGIGSVLLLALLERVAGCNGQRFASAIERQRGDAIVVLPRRLQTPPVDAVPHYDVVVAAARSKRTKSWVERYGINRIHNVEVFGFVGYAMALERVPVRPVVRMMGAHGADKLRTSWPEHREKSRKIPWPRGPRWS